MIALILPGCLALAESHGRLKTWTCAEGLLLIGVGLLLAVTGIASTLLQ
jgi:hypothetical protein